MRKAEVDGKSPEWTATTVSISRFANSAFYCGNKKYIRFCCAMSAQYADQPPVEQLTLNVLATMTRLPIRATTWPRPSCNSPAAAFSSG